MEKASSTRRRWGQLRQRSSGAACGAGKVEGCKLRTGSWQAVFSGGGGSQREEARAGCGPSGGRGHPWARKERLAAGKPFSPDLSGNWHTKSGLHADSGWVALRRPRRGGTKSLRPNLPTSGSEQVATRTKSRDLETAYSTRASKCQAPLSATITGYLIHSQLSVNGSTLASSATLLASCANPLRCARTQSPSDEASRAIVARS